MKKHMRHIPVHGISDSLVSGKVGNGMNTEMSPKKYITLFLSGTAVICAAAMLFMYAVDPWLYYRIKDENRYWLDGAYVSAGLIRNKQYDTAVIGSSYFQDFRMEWFREKLGEEPVNLTVPGLDLYEMTLISRAAAEEGKAQKQILCLTYYNFEEGVKRKKRIPEYLLDDTKWNDIQYLLSYEAWVKFLPLDIATYLADRISPAILEQYSSMMDTDKLGNELSRYSFGENQLMNSFRIPEKESGEKIEEISSVMSDSLNTFLYLMDFDKDTQYLFVLPPHSVLYWYYLDEKGLLDTYFNFENEVVQKLSSMKNIKIINAQTMPEIKDLDHYRDTTHYDLGIQEKIVDLIEKGVSQLTMENVKAKQETIRVFIEEFKADYGVA